MPVPGRLLQQIWAQDIIRDFRRNDSVYNAERVDYSGIELVKMLKEVL